MNTRPVVIGIASIQQKGKFDELDEALIMMDKAVKGAVRDTGNKSIKDYVDEIRVPKGFWKYRDPGKWIAKNNNFQKIPTTYVTKIGVLQQNLINEACLKIQNGEIRASLVLGGEARYKMLRSKIEDIPFYEKELTANPDYYVKAQEDLYGKDELEQLGAMAVGYYAVIETAIRKSKNEDLESHREAIGEMYQNFSQIAAKNPNAWIDKPFTKEEIITESSKNRMMAYPYNKLHCTSWNVNQSSALIICSEELADKLGIVDTKRVYPITSTENNHMLAIQQRPKLYKSMGMQYAAQKILEEIKRLKIDIDAYDLYSCFPAAVRMFLDALGISKNKIISLSGSMAFAGGPLNSYVLHSSVEMIRKIRNGNFNNGLVTGVSGMMTKQSFCVWGKKFEDKFLFHDLTNKAKLEEKPLKILDEHQGEGEIIGYTFFHDENKKIKAVLYLEDKNNRRKVVSTINKEFISLLKFKECVGKRVLFKKNQIYDWTK